MSAERESVIGVVSAVDALDLTADAHVHTGFSAGRDAVGVVVSAADLAGLSAITFADQVGPDTTWISAYADSVRRAQRRTELTLRIAAEVEVVRPDGWLALPPDISSLEALSVAVSRLPMAGGVVGPRDVRAMLTTGRITADQVAEELVSVTVRGIERASRYAPTQLARPLGLLAQVGLDDAVLSPDLIGALAAACRETGTLVEISESWRSPSPRVVAMLRASEVAMVPASDARYATEVGHWQYVRRV
ncbi:hydrolase [Actinoplanes sp. LDG1-06]|uniref:Hydrolase n=1 Tax=Paractinoplanes ovalisporus TaxID=2810368 RepID=A0ABS2AC48_9ACTN|nr:hydrolase [Actinoplanes ovalisporus]MBM2617397.1 hydrolase [Actinoplanes ovalisporus]